MQHNRTAQNVPAVPQDRNGSAGTSVERRFGSEVVQTSGERASTAAAESAKALIQAKFIMALQRQRDIMNVRASILSACKRHGFAQAARYMKPQFGAKACGVQDCPKRQRPDDWGNVKCNFVCGPSVRFADEAIKFLGNVDISQDVSYEDEDTRIVRVTALDLETNLSKSQTVSVRKVIERSKVRDGQEVIGERTNSKGQLVYLVKSSDDELMVKEANLCAKARRNQELQLLPQDIIEEAMDEVVKTLRAEVAKDPKAAVKATCDAFTTLGVSPAQLAEYLQHPVESCSPAEVDTLRKMYSSIKSGEASWADYMKPVEPVKPKVEQPPADGRRTVAKKAKAATAEAPKAETPSDPVFDRTVAVEAIESYQFGLSTEDWDKALANAGVPKGSDWKEASDEVIKTLHGMLSK